MKTEFSTDEDSASASEALEQKLNMSDLLNSTKGTASSISLNVKQLELVLHWINHTHKLFVRNEEMKKYLADTRTSRMPRRTVSGSWNLGYICSTFVRPA